MLDPVIQLQETFNRDAEIDLAEAARYARTVRDDEEEYDNAEIAHVDLVQKKFEGIREEDWSRIISPDPNVKMASYLRHGNPNLIGRGIVTVDSTVPDCTAWCMGFMSRESVKEHHANGGVERAQHVVNGHNEVIQLVVDLQVGTLRPRELLQRIIWRWTAPDTVVIASTSIELPEFPIRKE